MQIKIWHYEVLEAIQELMNKKYGMDVDLSEQCDDYPTIEHHVYERVYKKHANGKNIKDKNGYPILDKKESIWTKEYFAFGEMDEFILFINEKIKDE